MFMMREVESNNYDDFDMVKLEGEDSNAGLFSPFTFIFFLVLIALSGLLLLYSSTFDLAVRSGYMHYRYLFNQIIGAVIGVGVGIALNFVPSSLLKKSYLVLCPLAIMILVLELFPQFNSNGYLHLLGHDIVSGPLVGAIAIISLLSGTISPIYRLQQANGIFFTAIIIATMAIMILSGFVGGLGYYFLISFVLIIMLYASGAKKSFVLISGIFAIVTGLFMALVYPRFAHHLFSSIFPVPDPDVYSHDLFTSQLAIKEGGISGTGLGKGLYKLGVLADVEGRYIFASIAEEVGFIGIFVFLLAFLNYFFLGLMASRRAYKKEDYVIAGAALGISSLVSVQAVLSGLYCSGLFPFGSVDFPFFSYGPADEALLMIISLVLYRYIYLMGRQNEKK